MGGDSDLLEPALSHAGNCEPINAAGIRTATRFMNKRRDQHIDIACRYLRTIIEPGKHTMKPTVALAELASPLGKVMWSR
jgi:hypothetical protein